MLYILIQLETIHLLRVQTYMYVPVHVYLLLETIHLLRVQTYVPVHVYLLPCTEPLSDEKAQEIIDKALESSSIEMRNIVSVITGLMGSGKTWLLSRLFNQQPPELYTSTGIAEQSFRCLLHHMMSLSSWKQFSHRNILEFLALLFREKMPSADVAQVSAEMASMKLLTPVSTNQQPESDTDSFPSPTPQPPHHPHPTTTTGQSMVRLDKAPKS